jgi:hypothetical protein
MAGEIKSAVDATEVAVNFLKKYRRLARPIKAAREDNKWLVEIDVGPLTEVVARFTIDANSGKILEYHIPP